MMQWVMEQLIAKRRICCIEGNVNSYAKLLNSKERLAAVKEHNELCAAVAEVSAEQTKAKEARKRERQEKPETPETPETISTRNQRRQKPDQEGLLLFLDECVLAVRLSGSCSKWEVVSPVCSRSGFSAGILH